jgi:F-type H+-transporting ATPase subunit epsilon
VAHTPFRVEVLTPDGEVFNDEVEMVSTRTVVGSIGVLANHAPLLATLDPTELRLYRTESDIVRFAQSEGYLQVAGNHALLLVEEAYDPEALDAADLRERLQQAESEMESAGEDSERRRVAERSQRRLSAFLSIAEGGSDH